MNASGSAGISVPRRWGELVSPVGHIRIAVIAVLILFIYWGTIRHALISRWLHDGNWSHGWLIPLFSLYFLGTQREVLMRCRPRAGYLGAVILALSLAVYFASAWRLRMTYPQGLSMVGVIFGVTLLMGGWGVIRVAWFPILFLLFAIPLPHSIYVELTMPLRELASTVAAAVMPLFVPGLHTEAQAVVIDYVMPGMPAGTLNVEEACSGMRSTMAFVTLGVAMAYLGRRPTWQRIVMVLTCVPIAVFCNTIRVVVTGLLHVNGHEDLARGTAHQVLGILMFAVALGLFALTGYVLSHLLVEVPEEGAGEVGSA
ncbi:MAG: exosortase/archaeosortase family protein [Phycisphaerales bacterium]|nr:MAG: exosortase/archaeosortase family protein [Phycisphaerales bacterium]